MRPPLLSLLFFTALHHASSVPMDELKSSISDILEDRNLIPTNFTMVNFSSHHTERIILKFDVVKALWEKEKREYYILSDSYYGRLFQDTILEYWHDLEFTKHASFFREHLLLCTFDNSIYINVWLLHREKIGTPALKISVRPLGHFEANRTVFVESFPVSEMLVFDRGDEFDVLFDPYCFKNTVTCQSNISGGYYKWCEHKIYLSWELMGKPTKQDDITTTSLTETRVTMAQLGYFIETPEEEFFARFPNKTSALFNVPESGVFLLRCPEGTVFWFANDTEVKRFVCEDEAIDDIEIVDLRPPRHWIREDPIGNWTEEEATNSTQIPSTSPVIPTEREGTKGMAIAIVCFLAVALVAVVGGVWKWRKGREQNEEGGNEVERTEHGDNSQVNSNNVHAWNNANFVEE